MTLSPFLQLYFEHATVISSGNRSDHLWQVIGRPVCFAQVSVCFRIIKEGLLEWIELQWFFYAKGDTSKVTEGCGQVPFQDISIQILPFSGSDTINKICKMINNSIAGGRIIIYKFRPLLFFVG